MKLGITNENYSAIVCKVEKIIELEGCDNVVSIPLFGYSAIVSKDIKVGDVGILFTAETQLSDDYCKYNNLYRDQTLNSNSDKKGYMENNCRVRAMKFRGHPSSALFMPIESLSFIDGLENLKIGDSFNTINDIEICRKYEIFVRGSKQNKVKGKNKVFTRVEAKLFPEHLDTENYRRNKHFLGDFDRVYISQKLHGTSGRFGHIRVKKQLSIIDRILKYFGVKVLEYEYDYIAGSRKVIKDTKTQKETTGFYASDLWNNILEKYKTTIPKNWILYGEIIGRDGDKPIQKNYTYNLTPGQMELYVYRIVVINEDGIGVDLGFEQMIEFCEKNGINYVPYIENCLHKDLDTDKYLNINYNQSISNKCVPLCNASPCDEGIVIRRDGLQPFVLKDKSPMFLEHETKLLDKGEVDTESLESNNE